MEQGTLRGVACEAALDRTLRFTAVNPGDPEDQREIRLVIDRRPSGTQVQFQIPPGTVLNAEQLGEFGWLLVALAGNEYDPESARELIDGYGCIVPTTLETLAG